MYRFHYISSFFVQEVYFTEALLSFYVPYFNETYNFFFTSFLFQFTDLICEQLAKHKYVENPLTEIVRKVKPCASNKLLIFKKQTICPNIHSDKLMTSFDVKVLNIFSYTSNSSFGFPCTKLLVPFTVF